MNSLFKFRDLDQFKIYSSYYLSLNFYYSLLIKNYNYFIILLAWSCLRCFLYNWGWLYLNRLLWSLSYRSLMCIFRRCIINCILILVSLLSWIYNIRRSGLNLINSRGLLILYLLSLLTFTILDLSFMMSILLLVYLLSLWILNIMIFSNNRWFRMILYILFCYVLLFGNLITLNIRIGLLGNWILGSTTLLFYFI